MYMELIEKKNQPAITRMKFTKKEWENLDQSLKDDITSLYEVKETARQVYYDMLGDMLNDTKDRN